MALEISIPLWIPFVTSTFSGGTSRVDTDFGQRIETESTLSFATMARLFGRIGPWGLVVDTYLAEYANDVRFTFAEGDVGHVDLGGGMLRMAGSYRVKTLQFGKSETPMLLSVSPYAGTRFSRLNIDFDRDVSGFEEVRQWWDPIVGLRAQMDLRVGLVLSIEGDIGGFGVGSTIAGWCAGALEYSFLDWLALSAGANYVRYKQEAGTGSNHFEMGLSMYGPVLALSFHVQ